MANQHTKRKELEAKRAAASKRKPVTKAANKTVNGKSDVPNQFNVIDMRNAPPEFLKAFVNAFNNWKPEPGAIHPIEKEVLAMKTPVNEQKRPAGMLLDMVQSFTQRNATTSQLLQRLNSVLHRLGGNGIAEENNKAELSTTGIVGQDLEINLGKLSANNGLLEELINRLESLA